MRDTHIPAFWSVTELAAVLGVPRHRIDYWVKTGALPAIKIGRHRTSKVQIPSAVLRKEFPRIWDAILDRQIILEAGDDG